MVDIGQVGHRLVVLGGQQIEPVDRQRLRGMDWQGNSKRQKGVAQQHWGFHHRSGAGIRPALVRSVPQSLVAGYSAQRSRI